jgi:intein/homing endonuclease
MADLFGTYGKRIKLTVDHTKIDADLTWFPVTVQLDSGQGEEVFAEFDADEDIDRCAFTMADGVTQLYADCELFDDSESKAIYHVSKTGWVLDNDVDTDFYFYYDNDADHNSLYIRATNSTAIPVFSDWDDEYEGSVEPDSDGWSLVGNDYASVSSGILTIDTMASDGYFCAYDKTPDIDFDSGFYFKTRVKASVDMNSSDDRLTFDIRDGTDGKRILLEIYSNQIKWTTSSGSYITTTMDTTTDFIVYEIYAKGSTFWVYVDGVLKGKNTIWATSVSDYLLFGDSSSISKTKADIDYLYYALGVTNNPHTVHTNVWDTNFKAVYHMADTTTSTILDSTSNNNDGTKKGCLPEGTYIKTVNGYKDITDIKIGDEVFTYTEEGVKTERVKRVINSGVKQLYEIKTKNRNIRASGNHPFLTLVYKGKERKSGYNIKNKHPYSYLENNYSLEWIPLEELKIRDIIVTYSGGIAGNIENTEISLNVARFLGCFLGDGSNTKRKNRKNGGRIYLHLYNKKLITEYSKILFDEGIENTFDETKLLICKNELYSKLTKMGFMGNAHTKVIPDWVYLLSKEHKEKFIEGLIDSDGYKIQYGYGINLCNKKLLEQIRNICIDLGYRVGKIRYKKNYKSNINGREIIGGDSWVLSFYPNATKNHNGIRNETGNQKKRVNIDLPDGFEFQTINSIERLGEEETYDLEIENSHNFIADGIVVHNSGEPAEATGKVGQGQDFDGTDDYISIGTLGTLGSTISDTEITIYEGIVKTSETDAAVNVIGTANTGSTTVVQIELNKDKDSSVATGYVRVYLRDEDGNNCSGAVQSNTGITDGDPHYLAVNVDGGNNLIKVYIDGVLKTFTYLTQLTPDNMDDFEYSMYLGALNNRGTASSVIDGIIDESRVNTSARSAAWIKATYNSLYDTLLTYGDEETAGWTHKLNGATISKYNGSAFTKWNGVA